MTLLETLLEKICSIIGFPAATHLFCQHCSKEVTHIGAYVSLSRKVYCPSMHCYTEALKSGLEQYPGWSLYSSKELQRAIDNEMLRYYERPAHD